MRSTAFARRCAQEILRDPVSYCFCLGFPVVMLLVFRLVNASAGGAAPVFALPQLTSGITVFSFSFSMLYMALLVSGDRDSAFLTRLYCTPMTQADFALGYLLPGLAIAAGQACVCLVCAWALGMATGDRIPFARGLLQIISLLPAMLMAVSFGVLFGSLLSPKGAPGAASVLISASGFLSGAWMPLEQMGTFGRVCRALPYYPAVRVGRAVLNGAWTRENGRDLAVTAAWAALALGLAIWAQKRAMRVK